MTRHHDDTPLRYHVNRKYKDSLFRLIFSDKEGALELYNALNHSHYTDLGLVLEVAMESAIDDCIQQDVLKQFLLKHRGEVCNVILTRYDEAFHIQCEKKESFAEGEQIGYERGFEQGINRVRHIIHSLMDSGVAKQIICQNASITEEELDVILQEGAEGGHGYECF